METIEAACVMASDIAGVSTIDGDILQILVETDIKFRRSVMEEISMRNIGEGADELVEIIEELSIALGLK